MTGNKGITLIALVITIIIMLILAGVTISLVFNGGLIDYGKQASSQTNQRIQEEDNLSKGEVEVSGYGAGSNISNIVNDVASE